MVFENWFRASAGKLHDPLHRTESIPLCPSSTATIIDAFFDSFSPSSPVNCPLASRFSPPCQVTRPSLGTFPGTYLLIDQRVRCRAARCIHLLAQELPYKLMWPFVEILSQNVAGDGGFTRALDRWLVCYRPRPKLETNGLLGSFHSKTSGGDLWELLFVDAKQCNSREFWLS